MKTTELRIGNFIQDQFGDIITVDGLDDMDVFSSDCGDIPVHAVQPIPLTEQWLLDFGFIQHSKYFSMKCGRSRATQKPINFRICHTAAGNFLVMSPANESIYLHSVHQLQNLYFALTQEELILKKGVRNYESKTKQKNILPYTMEEVRDAFNEAMEECYLYGLNWREHMKPFHKNGQIAGYFVLDETKSTIIRKVMI